MSNISVALRTLASGVNPDTGEKLPSFISVHKEIKAAYLLKLANEIENQEGELNKRNEKKKAKSDRAKSLAWTDEKIEQLTTDFNSGKSIPDIASDSGRSEAAVAYRLIVANIAAKEHVLSLLNEPVKVRTLEIIETNERRQKQKEI